MLHLGKNGFFLFLNIGNTGVDFIITAETLIVKWHDRSVVKVCHLYEMIGNISIFTDAATYRRTSCYAGLSSKLFFFILRKIVIDIDTMSLS